MADMPFTMSQHTHGCTILRPNVCAPCCFLQGHCWVEGDNISDSEDSASSFGPLPVALIQGRVMAVFWPPGRMQGLGSRVPPGKLLMRNDAAFDVQTVT